MCRGFLDRHAPVGDEKCRCGAGQLGGSKGRAVEDEVVGQKLLDDVPLSAGMKAKLIARRRDAYQGDDAPVFASATGRPLYPQNVSRHILKPAAESVGLGSAASTPSATLAGAFSSRRGAT